MYQLLLHLGDKALQFLFLLLLQLQGLLLAEKLILQYLILLLLLILHLGDLLVLFAKLVKLGLLHWVRLNGSVFFV